MKKVKIVFDNNSSIIGEKAPFLDIFSNNIYKLKDFIKTIRAESNTVITLTETFKEEGIAELQRRAVARSGDFKRITDLLKDFIPKPIEIDNKLLKQNISDHFYSKISDNTIEVLPLPSKLTILELSKRSISYIPPFEVGDKGFKDTIAWFSILEDAENNPDFEYIIVTADKIFSEQNLKQEFKSITGKDIIVTSPESIEEVLDEVLELGLNLEKIRKDIENKIKQDNSFQNKLEKNALEKLNQNNSGSLYQRLSLWQTNEWESSVVNLIFNEANVSIKNIKDKNSFEAEAVITFKPKYSIQDKERDNSTLVPNYGQTVNPYMITSSLMVSSMNTSSRSYFPTLLKQNFTISYNNK